MNEKRNGFLKEMEFTSVQKLQKQTKIQWKTAVFSFLISVSPLGGNLLPFGCAFLCAVTKKERKSAFWGVLLGALFDKSIILSAFCVCFLYFILNAMDKTGIVPLKHKILLSASVGFLRATYFAVLGINGFADVFLVFSAAVSFPLFTVLFSGFFDKRKALRPKQYDFALLSLCFCLALLVSPFKLFSVSLALVPAAFFTLCVARTK